MDIRIAQFNPTVGDLKRNAARIYDIAKKNNDADIIVFPECALSGYPIEDLGLNKTFREDVTDVADKLNEMLMGLNVATIYGTPYQSHSKFYNLAFFVDVDTKVIKPFYKQDLPNYGVFDEKRVFSNEMGYFPPLKFRGKRFAVIICEDGWNGMLNNFLKSWPFDALLWLNGSPYETFKIHQRIELARELSCLSIEEAGTKATVVYANLVGGEDELVFDGQSFVLHGDELTIMDGFREYTESFIIDPGAPSDSRADAHPDIDPYLDTYKALVLGTRDFLEKQGFKSVVLGYSGGVDSGIVAAVACDAVGPENVHLVRLPSKFSSDHSLSDAENGAMRLGAKLRTIDIEPVVESLRTAYWSTRAGCNHWDWEQKELEGVSDENLQARARGTLLMAISNQEGHILLTTGNKSEVSVGYFTAFGGDSNGGFAPIKDSYKTQIFDLCRFRNSLSDFDLDKFGFLGNSGEVVPEQIITKPPSAELSQNQYDINSLPPYNILDEILYSIIERGLSAEEIINNGFEKLVVDKIILLVHRSEFKRKSLPPGIKLSEKILSRERRIPIVNKWIG